jgi:hypothetical protein
LLVFDFDECAYIESAELAFHCLKSLVEQVPSTANALHQGPVL